MAISQFSKSDDYIKAKLLITLVLVKCGVSLSMKQLHSGHCKLQYCIVHAIWIGKYKWNLEDLSTMTKMEFKIAPYNLSNCHVQYIFYQYLWGMFHKTIFKLNVLRVVADT